jgi:uncharacterized membrane protein required for colicin V production
MRVTFFDVLFLLGMVGGAAWGFYRGLFRSALGTVVIYISMVVSSLGYRSLSRMLSRATEQPAAATDVLAFAILMVVLVILLLLMGRDLMESIDSERMGVWLNITGMVFGFVNAAIICGIVLIVIRYATNGDEWIGYQGVQTFFQNQTRNSWLAFVFRPFLRFLIGVIRPWLFGHDLPPLLVNAI